MAISQQLRKRIEEVADDLNFELYGPKGCPPWGTKFVDMEQTTTEVGDTLSCVMLSKELQRQAEAEGHPAGKCGGCGEPIPFNEVAGRLLDARRGEIAWQESYGRCKRCRKAFFPSLPSFGNRAG
jgi:hypothetical protein